MLSSFEIWTKHAAWDTWYNFAWWQQEKQRMAALAHEHHQYKLAAEALQAFR